MDGAPCVTEDWDGGVWWCIGTWQLECEEGVGLGEDMVIGERDSGGCCGGGLDRRGGFVDSDCGERIPSWLSWLSNEKSSSKSMSGRWVEDVEESAFSGGRCLVSSGMSPTHSSQAMSESMAKC